MFKFWKRKPVQHDDETLLIHTMASMLNEDSGWELIRIGEVTVLAKDAFTITHIPDKEIVTIACGDTFVSISDTTPIPHSLVTNLSPPISHIPLSKVITRRIQRVEESIVTPASTFIGRKLNGDEKDYSAIDLAASLCEAAHKIKWSSAGEGSDTIKCGEVSVRVLNGWRVIAMCDNTHVHFEKGPHPILCYTFTKFIQDLVRKEEERKKAERANSVKTLLDKLLS